MARKHKRVGVTPLPDVERLSYGGAKQVWRNGKEWFLREVPAHRADKTYTCPSCSQLIPVAQSHVVVWSADNLFGDEAAVRDRRHWHTHCWRAA